MKKCTTKPCKSAKEIETCSPGGKKGMFIMYFSSNFGAFPNNKLFSPCSKKVIEELFKTPSRQKCLKSNLYIFI